MLTRSLLPELSTELLARLAADQPIKAVRVSINDKGSFAYDIS
jgi:hypothetical protein